MEIDSKVGQKIWTASAMLFENTQTMYNCLKKAHSQPADLFCVEMLWKNKKRKEKPLRTIAYYFMAFHLAKMMLEQPVKQSGWSSVVLQLVVVQVVSLCPRNFFSFFLSSLSFHLSSFQFQKAVNQPISTVTVVSKIAGLITIGCKHYQAALIYKFLFKWDIGRYRELIFVNIDIGNSSCNKTSFVESSTSFFQNVYMNVPLTTLSFLLNLHP